MLRETTCCIHLAAVHCLHKGGAQRYQYSFLGRLCHNARLKQLSLTPYVQVLIGTNDNELQQRLLGSGAFSIPAEFLINDIRKVR